ncbi:MAG: ATP-binding cassette domain-containing protein, partial [Acidobacteriota bacterium]|nr:ATP-binding cassette domain-containing protein [Acidobacteriota bacterium]
LQYVLWLASWAILASLSNSGRMDRAWLLGWALLLMTLVPCQVMTTWLQGLFAIGLGGLVKRRLLCGALKLFPQEMRHGGIGSFLGQALEAEAVETLALSGGIAGLLATVEIVLAMFVLGRFALVLAFWSVFTTFVAWRFLRAFARWTDTRMAMTEDLVEAMVGHRTRVAQLQRSEWHEGEDQALHGYLAVSKSLDNAGAWLIAAIPRGWLLAGLACLLPAFGARQGGETNVGLTLGGVLLAYTALRKLTGSFADLAAAWVAFKRIEPLFQAAARQEVVGETLGAKSHRSRKVIEADRLSYRYRATGKAALQAGSLTVQQGDRILLEGPSGGGKTTFASLLSGMREPESGLLLSNGLDRATLGSSEWRKRIASAPQFHENHILTETLAFNLLLGRQWPPMPADMEDAETVCRKLGLGVLLDAMPSGLMQMVGEGGWQLSHGERSRVFIARALLQNADLVILDESFAALDPENVKVALEATIERAKTLMVIAHP